MNVVRRHENGRRDRTVRDRDDLVYDNDHGMLTTVTSAASIALITPPPRCKKMQINTYQGVYVNTQNMPAASDGTAMNQLGTNLSGRCERASGVTTSATSVVIWLPLRGRLEQKTKPANPLADCLCSGSGVGGPDCGPTDERPREGSSASQETSRNRFRHMQNTVCASSELGPVRNADASYIQLP